MLFCWLISGELLPRKENKSEGIAILGFGTFAEDRVTASLAHRLPKVQTDSQTAHMLPSWLNEFSAALSDLLSMAGSLLEAPLAHHSAPKCQIPAPLSVNPIWGDCVLWTFDSCLGPLSVPTFETGYGAGLESVGLVRHKFDV
jgi:hypothetical protein